MGKPFRIAVILEIETDDPRLSAENCNAASESARATERVRVALMGTLPKGVRRVVAITSPELMRTVLHTHELACEITGVSMFQRPPRDYEPPDGR